MLSIVIPVYNKAHTLSISVESVLRQTDDDWNLIIVDDGSQDNFECAVEPYKSDLRIQIIRRTNGGVSVARNDGIAASNSSHICFLDADDEWLENHIAEIRRMIQAFPDAGLYCTAVRVIGRDGRARSSASAMRGFDRIAQFDDYFGYTDEIGGSTVLYPSAVCVARDAIRRIGGFQPGVKIGEDYDLWLRIAAYYPVVLNRTETAVYHHELSTATRDTDMDVNWFFLKRESILTKDSDIPAAKRRNIANFCDRFRVRQCRHLMLAGEKRRAWFLLRQIRLRRVIWLKMLVTYACMAIPSGLIRRGYQLKRH